MVIVLQILLALAAFGALATFVMRRRTDRDRLDLLERRVEAYMLTIRREQANPTLDAMSDPELRDLLFASARNLRLQKERRWYVLLGGAMMAMFAAIIVATEEGMRGFGLVLLVAALVLYGLNEVLGRRMRQPMDEMGIDAERLRVE